MAYLAWESNGGKIKQDLERLPYLINNFMKVVKYILLFFFGAVLIFFCFRYSKEERQEDRLILTIEE